MIEARPTNILLVEDEGIRMASSQPEFDLILMDIDLGHGMDGTDAARAILQTRDVPIVFLSSHTEPEVVRKTETITSYGYIPKSAGDAILLGSVKMAFRLFEANCTIAESETACLSMFEANPHPMWVYDLETLRFLAVNDAAVHQYGYSEKEFLAMSIRDIRPEEDVEPKWYSRTMSAPAAPIRVIDLIGDLCDIDPS